MKLQLAEWGPSGWNFLQAVAFGYPKNPTDDDRREYLQFFMGIGKILPCEKCKEHYKLNTKIYPIDLSNTRSITEWINRLHNHVNMVKGKPYYPYLRMVADYSPDCARLDLSNYEREIVKSYLKCVNWSMITFFVLLIMMIIFVIFYFLNKYRRGHADREVRVVDKLSGR